MIKARTFDQVSSERMQAEPTPETDAAEERRPTWIPDVVQVGVVPVGFARSMERERNKLRATLQRIADCDWVITLPDRMDAVRKIARDALEAVK